MPGIHPTPAELAQTAYAAYGTSTGGLSHDGLPLPSWEGLGDTIQTAWAAAAVAVVRAVTAPEEEG
ncbi:hypothetical protein [Streptomyces sp. NPDC058280]|uniref:hypothetical protein n=1 Tax=Streptomyces sp. NPDC058280 TaxID=3346419 RepID=UPI0036E76E81